MTGPDDTTRSVSRCSEAFDDVVPALLARHPWNFAMSVVQLAGSAEAKPGWTYAFPKPADILRIVRVSTTDIPDDVGLRYADSAGEILTDNSAPYLRYISSSWVTLLGSWPDVFADAVAAHVAWEVAPVLSQSEAKIERLANKASGALRIAKSWDAQQQPNFTVPPGKFIRARTGRRWGYDDGAI